MTSPTAQNKNRSHSTHQQATRKSVGTQNAYPTQLDLFALQNAMEDPRQARPETILQLQRTVGNQVVQRLIREADHARATHAPTLMLKREGSTAGVIQRQEGEEEMGGLQGEPESAEPGIDPALLENLAEQPEGPGSEMSEGEPGMDAGLGETLAEQPEGLAPGMGEAEPGVDPALLAGLAQQPEGEEGLAGSQEEPGVAEPEEAIQLKRDGNVVQRNFLTDWASGVGDRIKQGNRWYKRSLPMAARVLPPVSRGVQGLAHGAFEGGRVGVKTATSIWDKLGTRDAWNNANDTSRKWYKRAWSGLGAVASGALGGVAGLVTGAVGGTVGAGAGLVGGVGRGTYSTLRGVGLTMGSQAANLGRIGGMQFGQYPNSSGQSWHSVDASRFTNDEATKSTAWAPFAVAGTGMSAATMLKGGIDVVSGGKEHATAKAAGKGASRELAWKKIKGGLKNLGTGALGTAGGVLGSIASIGGAVKSGSSAVTNASAAVPIVGLVAGGIDFLRNGWSMIRASHKARKIGETSGRLKALINTRNQDIANLDPTTPANLNPLTAHPLSGTDPTGAIRNRYAQDITDAGEVRDVAKYARIRKIRKALGSTGGMVGAGLGIAGTAALLAGAGPVGWGLIGAGAAVGLGYGLYKLIKGGVKRYKRIKRMRQALKTGGVGNADLRSEHGKWHQFFFGGRVKRMKEKGERAILADVQNNVNPGFLNGVARNDLRTTAKANLNDPTLLKYTQFLEANKTTKQKKADLLIKHLGDPNSAAYPHAVKLARQLGVLTKKNNEIRIRRGLFSGDRVNGDRLPDILNDAEDKEALASLLTRKFAAGL